MKTWLTALEVVLSEVTCSWRLKELLYTQVQVTIMHSNHYQLIYTITETLDHPPINPIPVATPTHCLKVIA